MGNDTKIDVCSHGFRTMTFSSLYESGLWSEDAIERQMSYKERKKLKGHIPIELKLGSSVEV